MHTEKQEIFDRYAEAKGYIDWNHLMEEFQDLMMDESEFLIFMFEACDIVQKEQQKRIAENAVIEPKGMMTKVDKFSILSENNIIK